MNFVFISPNFPHTYWLFCNRLRRNGAPYYELEESLKQSLTEYYRFDSLENYWAVHEAVRFFSEKYGKIDWLESNNEYWLEQDARLRSDFDITTGVKSHELEPWKRKSLMHNTYVKAGIPTADQYVVETREGAEEFIKKVGYPVIAKPDNGVGAAHTYKIENAEQLDNFFNTKPDVLYVMEEFIEGNICSYDAIIDSHGKPLFESMGFFPPSIADIVNKDLDLHFHIRPHVDPKLQKLGRKAVEAFNVKRRFVHFEFFCLTKPNKHIGGVGEYSGLEVNMRPAGGYTPDMMDYAHNTDVYQIWADMVTTDKRYVPESENDNYCFYASRKDRYHYVHSHEEVLAKYGNRLVMCDRMPEVLAGAMGSQMYVVCVPTPEAAQEFLDFVLAKAE